MKRTSFLASLTAGLAAFIPVIGRAKPTRPRVYIEIDGKPTPPAYWQLTLNADGTMMNLSAWGVCEGDPNWPRTRGIGFIHRRLNSRDESGLMAESLTTVPLT